MSTKQYKFGLILKKIRTQKKMTQDELASLIGKTPGTIAQFERNDIYPNFETLSAIINVLDIDANLFFSRKPVEYSDKSKWIASIIDDMDNNKKEILSEFLYKISYCLNKSDDKKMTK